MSASGRQPGARRRVRELPAPQLAAAALSAPLDYRCARPRAPVRAAGARATASCSRPSRAGARAELRGCIRALRRADARRPDRRVEAVCRHDRGYPPPCDGPAAPRDAERRRRRRSGSRSSRRRRSSRSLGAARASDYGMEMAQEPRARAGRERRDRGGGLADGIARRGARGRARGRRRDAWR